MGIVKFLGAIVFCVMLFAAPARAAECEGDCENGRGTFYSSDGKKLYEGQFNNDYPLER